MAVISIAHISQTVSCGIAVVLGDVNECLDKKGLWSQISSGNAGII